MASTKYLQLNDGSKMPALGIGTWMATDEEIELAIDEALQAGYRHIDTALAYLNEQAIGRVLKRWLEAGKIKREELFIVTKLPPSHNRPEQVESTLKTSLAALQLDYVDLYLVHTPFTIVMENNDFKRDENGVIVVDKSTDHLAVWKKMEEAQRNGLTKSIGVSNFNVSQLKRLLDGCTVKPASLQIEHHVYLQQPELVKFCKDNGIVITAYAPLGSKGIAAINKMAGLDREVPDLLDLAVVKDIAKAHGKTPAQVLLRWIVGRDIAAIPKSVNPKRLRENLDIFDFSLTPTEMGNLNALDANLRVCDFKFFPGVEKHPEFPF